MLLPQDYCYDETDYGVKVHPAESPKSKSVFSLVPDVKKHSGELYLKSLSRETSNIGFDIYTMFSDAEARMILNRTQIILDAITRELEKLNKLDKLDESNQTMEESDLQEPKNLDINASNPKVYREKLLRFKKIFSYRKTILDYKNTGDIDELKQRVLVDIGLRNSNDNEIKTMFFEKYSDDILAASIQFVFQRCVVESKDTSELISAIRHLNRIH